MRAVDPTSQILRPDLCILGGGACGLAVAAGALALGFSVVVVEKAELGGQGLAAGVPRLALGAVAKAAAGARDAQRFGVEADVRINATAMRAHIASVAAALARDAAAVRFEAMGARVIRAAGRFTGKDRLEAGRFVIKSRRFVIATGSRPLLPPVTGLNLVRYLTPDSVFALADWPQRLVILGDGAAAVELAQAFARIGCEVALLAQGRLLGEVDAELAAILIAQLRRDGVHLREAVTLERVEPSGSGVQVILGGTGEAIDGSHLLIAAGRRPNVDGLGLDAAGITFDGHGVKTGADLRNPGNRRVFALGDCAFPAQGASAEYLASLLLRRVLHLPGRLDAHGLPLVVHADPEIAVVGLTEEAARARHKKILILRWPFAANDRARIDGEATGHVKLIVSKAGKILGAGIVGSRAGDMIVPWILAISRGLRVTDVAALAVPAATRSTAAWRAATAFSLSRLRKPWLRRILDLARRWG